MRRLLSTVFLFALVSVSAFAQSADQEVVSVTDSPDPVIPGNNLTYTITLRNNGPDPATDGGINVNLPAGVTYQSTATPPGFTCFVLGSNMTCFTPSFAAGDQVVFAITVRVDSSLLNFPDGSLSANFFPSGTTPDPNNANNAKTETTTYDSPQIDMALSVTDSPDPVTPNGTITYTVTLTNNGPDTATNALLNTFNNGSLRFQSVTVPAGWTCTAPAVGSAPVFTCSNPSLASGASSTLTVVVLADPAILGINDGTLSTSFAAAATGNDTNNSNNSETENTQYITPDADLSVTASDSPDPVIPDSNITYTITVVNSGPDSAPNTVLNIPMNNTLRFHSVTSPAGWTCNPPAVGGGTSWSCTHPDFPAVASSVFTVVLRANTAVFGNADQTINQTFNVGSSIADPDNTDNNLTVSTIYAVPNANLSITKTTASATAATGSTVSYSLTVTNSGPEAAGNVVVNDTLPAGLSFVSATPSQGSCNAASPLVCNLGTLLVSGSATITIQARLTGTTGTIINSATVQAAVDDPVPGNNASTASAITITGPASGAQIPMLSNWVLIALAALLCVAALIRIKA